MDYKKIMSELPVSINSVDHERQERDEEFFDAEIEGVTITATNVHFPLLGNFFTVTFQGKGWQKHAIEAIRQLGKSAVALDITGDKETLSWKSCKKGAPIPIQIRRLGLKKFSAIAKEHHLSESETGILKNLLIANQMHTLNPVGIRSREDWMAVIYSKARNAKSRRRIQGALLAVEQAYDKFTQDLLNN